MDLEKLRVRAKYINFSVGDIIIDLMTRNVGILLRKEQRIDWYRRTDHICVWEIVWTNISNEPFDVSNARYMEEEGLKMSIVAGMYEWHCIKDSLFMSIKRKNLGKNS